MFLTRFHLPSRNLFLLPALMLVACATSGQQGMAVKDTAMFSQLRSSEHRAADDDLPDPRNVTRPQPVTCAVDAGAEGRRVHES